MNSLYFDMDVGALNVHKHLDFHSIGMVDAMCKPVWNGGARTPIILPRPTSIFRRAKAILHCACVKINVVPMINGMCEH